MTGPIRQVVRDVTGELDRGECATSGLTELLVEKLAAAGRSDAESILAHSSVSLTLRGSERLGTREAIFTLRDGVEDVIRLPYSELSVAQRDAIADLGAQRTEADIGPLRLWAELGAMLSDGPTREILDIVLRQSTAIDSELENRDLSAIENLDQLKVVASAVAGLAGSGEPLALNQTYTALLSATEAYEPTSSVEAGARYRIVGLLIRGAVNAGDDDALGTCLTSLDRIRRGDREQKQLLMARLGDAVSGLLDAGSWAEARRLFDRGLDPLAQEATVKEFLNRVSFDTPSASVGVALSEGERLVSAVRSRYQGGDTSTMDILERNQVDNVSAALVSAKVSVGLIDEAIADIGNMTSAHADTVGWSHGRARGAILAALVRATSPAPSNADAAKEAILVSHADFVAELPFAEQRDQARLGFASRLIKGGPVSEVVDLVRENIAALERDNRKPYGLLLSAVLDVHLGASPEHSAELRELSEKKLPADDVSELSHWIRVLVTDPEHRRAFFDALVKTATEIDVLEKPRIEKAVLESMREMVISGSLEHAEKMGSLFEFGTFGRARALVLVGAGFNAAGDTERSTELVREARQEITEATHAHFIARELASIEPTVPIQNKMEKRPIGSTVISGALGPVDDPAAMECAELIEIAGAVAGRGMLGLATALFSEAENMIDALEGAEDGFVQVAPGEDVKELRIHLARTAGEALVEGSDLERAARINKI